MNHYEVLCIPVDADEGMIRSAFRRLARRYHPDAGRGSSSEKFRELTDAYETLLDPVRRTAYDNSLARPSTAIPIRITHVRESRPAPVSHVVPLELAFASRSISELHFLMDEVFRSFERELFFNWPFLRR
jgi:curved DNA-binding protein CbpA